ncbi:MAG: hypothetical protein U9O86_11100 [Campylobacterota bacterium]|nr:hypothetical protein [Campylobacterota bacterium]
MGYVLKIIMLLIFIGTFLNAGPARGGLIKFTQPDGTQFEGYLKGDSTFHWIESNSKVVMYNKEDRFYYNAKVNNNGKLEISNTKPVIINKLYEKRVGISLSEKRDLHTLDKESVEALRRLQNISRKGNHPR